MPRFGFRYMKKNLRDEHQLDTIFWRQQSTEHKDHGVQVLFLDGAL